MHTLKHIFEEIEPRNIIFEFSIFLKHLSIQFIFTFNILKKGAQKHLTKKGMPSVGMSPSTLHCCII